MAQGAGQQEAEGRGQEQVGDPVGALIYTQIQPGHGHGALQPFFAGQGFEVDRDQAKINQDSRVEQRGGPQMGFGGGKHQAPSLGYRGQWGAVKWGIIVEAGKREMGAKRILMIAFHFPPLAGSSGIQRTLRFVQHLPAFGWEPIVLTAHPRAYASISDDLLREVPANVAVHRAFALDTARHLSIARRYPGVLARPDRWMTWRWGAKALGLRLIRRYNPDILWSTYPIATAHQIGSILHQYSGVPWIADFRDPMAQEGYPADPKTWQSFKRIEETAFKKARFCVFTSPGAARVYRQRYPETPPERTVLIENGYDEDSFTGLDASAAAKGPLNPGKITLLHSGIVYPSERNPSQLFQAIGALLKSGDLNSKRFVIRLRATAHDDWLRSLALEHGIMDAIELAPPLLYRMALEEMLRADGLVILQATNCNEQVPAKLYEYLRAERPILGLTDPSGDTALTLRQAGCQHLARLDSREELISVLPRFVDELASGVASRPDSKVIAVASRLARTQALAELMDSMI